MSETATCPRLWLPRRTRPTTADRLDFQEDGVTGTTYTATFTDLTHLDPEAFVTAVAARMTAASTKTYAGSVTADGHSVLIPDAGTVKLVSAPSGARNLHPELGYDAAGSAAFVAASTSPYQMQGFWTPGLTSEGFILAPRVDTYDQPEQVEGRTRSLRGLNRRVKHSLGHLSRGILFELLPTRKVITLPGAADPNEAFDQVWDLAKDRFRWWPDRLTLGTFSDYYLTSPSERYEPERMRPGRGFWRLDLDFAGYVS